MNLLGRLKIKLKLALLLALSALSLTAAAALGASVVHGKLVTDRERQIQRLVEVATGLVKEWHAKETAGTLRREQAQAGALAALRPLRYGADDYFFIQDYRGVTILNDPKPELEGRERLDAKDPDGVPNVRLQIEAAKSGGGVVYYRFPRPGSTEPVQKVSYAGGFAPWEWAICTGVYIDDIAAEYRRTLLRLGLAALGIIVVTALITWLVNRDIAGPLTSLQATMERLAAGDLELAVDGIARRDEIGGMARAVLVFQDNAVTMRRLEAEREQVARDAEAEKRRTLAAMADDFESKVSGIVATVHRSATDMHSAADGLTASAEGTRRQARAVADGASEATQNVQTVASASNELSTSIAEIGRQIVEAASLARQANEAGQGARTTVAGLSTAVDKIGQVAELIAAIAGQTNLLALNATIEAARAGEAGRGFAVVAGEVKSLATQTAQATEGIRAQIAEIQAATAQAVGAIKAIAGSVGSVDEISTSIASAVEEQSSATQEIARNVQHAAAATGEVSANIAGVSEAASETGDMATRVSTASERITHEVDTLRREVEKFLAGLQAA